MYSVQVKYKNLSINWKWNCWKINMNFMHEIKCVCERERKSKNTQHKQMLEIHFENMAHLIVPKNKYIFNSMFDYTIFVQFTYDFAT